MPNRRAFVFVVIALGAVVSGLAVWAVASSQDGGSNFADPNLITTLPFTGYPTDVAPGIKTPFSEPTCQAPEDERPDPDLPPLSCRKSDLEPPPGSIETAAPEERPAITPGPKGEDVRDNVLFRYTYVVPEGWYSNMRPEGGAFVLSDAPGTNELLDPSSNPSGGIIIFFSARNQLTQPLASGTWPVVEEHLQNPNSSFGSLPGAVWDEGPGEGAFAVRGAFAKDGIVFEFYALVGDLGRAPDDVTADIEAAKATLASVTPY